VANVRIALGGIMHESNSFSAQPTTLGCFRAASLIEGEEIRTVWGQAEHEVGGFFEGAEQLGLQTVPTLMGWATPSGMVEPQALDTMLERMIELLDGGRGLDGLLLALHGAMVLEGHRDGDAAILWRLRKELGPDFPIVCTLDFHANVSPDMIGLADALVMYQTNPHVDQRATGLRAAELITRIAGGEVRPALALEKPRMIFPILHQNTSADPLRSLLASVRELEQQDGVLIANVAAGFPYADVPEMGPSVLVTTDGDEERARREARRLSEQMWGVRGELETDLPGAEEAIRMANESGEEPIILVEMGDNVGGGSAADGTCVLEELLRQRSERFVIVIYDPGAVQECARAGEQAQVDLEVGGKTDDLHGAPVRIQGTVRTIHDGRYEETEVRHGGKRFNDQGLTAVVELDRGSLVLLNSLRDPPFSLQQLISLGIRPEGRRILVVKAAIAYRAAYEPIARRIIEADTPGTTTPSPARLQYTNIRRPMFPLDRQ